MIIETYVPCISYNQILLVHTFRTGIRTWTPTNILDTKHFNINIKRHEIKIGRLSPK